MEDIKILFRFYSELLEEHKVETVWARRLEERKDLFQINNIPFYIPNIANGDVVRAEYDDKEQFYVFKELVGYSGNSVVRVVLMDEEVEIDKIRKKFKEIGCPSEKLNDRYFVMGIPKDISYSLIKSELEKLENIEMISYEEAVLSDGHKGLDTKHSRQLQ